MPISSILFILHGSRSTASSRVRGFWIADELEKQGIECRMRWQRGKRELLCLAAEIPKHDVIVFQKTYSRWHRALMLWANCLGKRTFMDIDDYPTPTLAAHTKRTFEGMLRMSDGVLVGSEALLDYVRPFQPSAFLVPSGIRLRDYPMKVERDAPEDGAICLGWTGNANSYAKDVIAVLTGPLTTIARETTVRLKLVGACGRPELYETFGQVPGLKLDCIDTLEWGNPVEVANALKDFDIGLYPLLPDHYNYYKCGFKALEYMAMGIPVVSSRVAVNPRIIEHGKDGLLADTSEEWVDALRTLIADPSKRKRMGLAGRAKVEKDHNVETVAQEVREILAAN